MHDLVVLWYSPDGSCVRPLVNRLRAIGINLFEYSSGMGAGDLIASGIEAKIRQAKLVLFCLSNAAVEHSMANGNWLATEAAWAFQAFARRPEGVLLAQVDAFDRKAMPPTLQGRNVLDLRRSQSFESMLERLVVDVMDKLNQPRPEVILASIIAMTQEECAESLSACRIPPFVSNLCPATSAGGKELQARYGDSRQGFAPFSDGKSCVDLVELLLNEVNVKRRRMGRIPVHLRWLDQIAFDEDATRRLWREGWSLLIVDGASLHHPNVARLFANIPPPNKHIRSAVVCLPPHTHALSLLQDCVRGMCNSLENKNLADCLGDWENGEHLNSGRSLSFDTSLFPGFREWMFRALTSVGMIESAHPTAAQKLGSKGQGLDSYLEDDEGGGLA